ncbi:MAG: hypothetical protein IID30_11755 [Planctomycetes bacterium]|nr:hypothetical protein [Planctomycetota bacterium]
MNDYRLKTIAIVVLGGILIVLSLNFSIFKSIYMTRLSIGNVLEDDSISRLPRFINEFQWNSESPIMVPWNTQRFTVKYKGDLFTDNETRFVAVMKGLNLRDHYYSAEEFRNGVDFSLNTKSEGRQILKILANNSVVTRIPIFTYNSDRRPVSPDSIAWELVTGGLQVIDGKFKIPIFATAYSIQNEIVTVDEDIMLSVIDLNDPSVSLVLRASAGNAVTTSQLLGIDVHREYALHITNAKYHKVDRLVINWDTYGPQLEFQAIPSNQETYATPMTKAQIYTYLSWNGRRVDMHGNLSIVSSGPAAVSIQPISMTTASTNTHRFVVQSTSPLQNAALNFEETASGLSAIAYVDFLFPTTFLIIATIAGLIGAIVAHKATKLFRQKWWLTIVEFVIAALAGLLLYASVILDWLPVPGTGSLVGVLPAMVIGLIGGFVGEGVFIFGKKLFV